MIRHVLIISGTPDAVDSLLTEAATYRTALGVPVPPGGDVKRIPGGLTVAVVGAEVALYGDTVIESIHTAARGAGWVSEGVQIVGVSAHPVAGAAAIVGAIQEREKRRLYIPTGLEYLVIEGPSAAAVATQLTNINDNGLFFGYPLTGAIAGALRIPQNGAPHLAIVGQAAEIQTIWAQPDAAGWVKRENGIWDEEREVSLIDHAHGYLRGTGQLG